MSWNKYFSEKLNSFFWHNSITKESVLKNPIDIIDSNSDNKQFWSRQISKKFNKPYWHNCKTGEAIWEISAEILEQKEEKKATVSKPTNVVKTEEEKPRQYRESSSYSMQIANGNGQSWIIEYPSHLTEQEKREALQHINENMRDY